MNEPKVFYQPSNHSEKLLTKIQSCWNDERLTDVVLVAEGQRIPAHRLVLATSSDYFNGMFTSELRETRATEVVIQGVSFDALQKLVTYMYTGSLSLQAESIEDILTASCMLQLSEVVNECSKFLVDHLHPSNCLGILQFSDRQGCMDLYKVAHNYVMENFVDIVQGNSAEFLELHVEELEKLLCSDYVNVPNEEALFQAVVDWVSHDQSSRNEYLLQLLSLLRLQLMNPEFLAEQIEPHPLLRDDPQCQRLIMEAMKFHLLQQCRRSAHGSKQKPRKSTVGVLLAVGGSEPTCNRMPSMEKYEFRTDRWHESALLNSRRLQFGVAVVNNQLWLVGGRDGLKTLNTVDVYDLQTKTWTHERSIATHRHGLCVTTLAGPIYAIGGHDGWTYLCSVERWDSESRQWSYVSHLNKARGTAGVAVISSKDTSKIYVCGGRDASSCLRSLESFDPHTNKWTTLAPMNKRRGGLGLVALNGYLYAVGGQDCPAQNKQNNHSNNRFSCCERYDPISDQWSLVAPLHGPRDALGLCVLGDKIYCVGGYDGQRHLRDVETYDQNADKWTKVCPLAVGRAGACVVHVSCDIMPLARSLSTLTLQPSGSPKLDRLTQRMCSSYSEPRFNSNPPPPE